MQEVFLVDARRTPFGSYGGSLAGVPATELATTVLIDLLQRTGLPANAVDEVILGQVLQGGSGQAPARQAMRAAGIPDSAAAMTINKVCGSGLKSVMLGADSLRLGHSRIVLAGGMENMSATPYAMPSVRFGQRMGHATAFDLMLTDGLLDPYSGRHMGEITEEWVLANEISREAQDDFAARSYRLAQQAVESKLFDREVAAVTIKGRRGDTVVDKDEEPFRGDIEKLPSLRPVFSKAGSITAGNASTLNDGAAILMLASAEAVKEYKLEPFARLISQATNSIHPNEFAGAPVGAIRRCAEAGGVPLEQIDLFEINEAFAAVPLVAINQLDLDPDKINVHGGACAIGHPIGASGARLATTVLHEMQARQVRYGLATLCIGGGEAVACLFECC